MKKRLNKNIDVILADIEYINYSNKNIDNTAQQIIAVLIFIIPIVFGTFTDNTNRLFLILFILVLVLLIGLFCILIYQTKIERNEKINNKIYDFKKRTNYSYTNIEKILKTIKKSNIKNKEIKLFLASEKEVIAMINFLMEIYNG